MKWEKILAKDGDLMMETACDFIRLSWLYIYILKGILRLPPLDFLLLLFD